MSRVGGGVVVVALLSAAADAAEGDFEVVVEGLNNPRHVAVDVDGTLLVAEAGRGGFRPVQVTLLEQINPVCVGLTSRVSRFEDGRRRTIARLPSWSAAAEDGSCPGDGVSAIGAAGVTADADAVAFTIGLAAAPDDRDALAETFRQARLFGKAFNFYDSQFPGLLADLAEFELDDADGQGVDSNPYGIAADGVTRLVTDAGANALVRVDPLLGPSIVATFALHCVPWTADAPNPVPDDANPCGDPGLFPAQPVPTDVAIGPDGAYYVSELGGFPFVPETSRIWRIEPDRVDPAMCVEGDGAAGCEVYASGLTSVVSLDFDDDTDALYAAQISDQGVGALEAGGEDAAFGSVVRIAAGGGAPRTVLTDLVTPGGIDVADGFLYASEFSVFPEVGQIVRISTDQLVPGQDDNAARRVSAAPARNP